MASVRGLKKDIDLIMSLVLNDCFSVLSQNSKVDENAVMSIAGDVIQKHRELRIKVNHPDAKDDPKQVKTFYKNISNDLLEYADKSLEKLSKEIKKTAG